MFYNTCISCGLSDVEACQVSPLVRDIILDSASFRLYEDAVSTLRILSADGWRHVMLSNNFPELKDLSYQIGIGEYFDDFIISALVGFDKPRREIFDIARTRAGHPDICLMIGDNFAADIIGAKMAGMQSVLVHQQDAAAPFYCAQLADLVPLLRQNFANAIKEATPVEKIESTDGSIGADQQTNESNDRKC
jgi:FMN phosphatase YigB (HAD superfamily)